jgi:predicted metal-dependent phosphoesterase TrpH
MFLTDHDTVIGANLLKDVAAGSVVIGQEVSTLEGDVVGLFLSREVRPGQTAQETVHQIKDQGGLIYLPHPMDPTRASLPPEVIDRVANDIDIIEVFNGRSAAEHNREAERLSRDMGALQGAGSDAHHLNELGKVYVEIEAFHGPHDFLRKLARARIVMWPSRLLLRCAATLHRAGRP